MKILVYGHSNGHLRQRTMFEWIAQQGHKVDSIIMPSYREEVYEPIKNGSFTQHLQNVYSVKDVSNMWYFPSLHEYVHKQEPDLLYCVQEPWTYAAYAGLKVAELYRIPFGFFTWENILKGFPKPWRQIESKVIGESDFAIGGNKDAADILMKKGANNVYKELQTGLDPSLFNPSPKLKFKEEQKPKEILFVGRLVRNKGIQVILDAFDKLPEGEFTLKFVGGRGEMEENIRNHVKFGKSITLEGWTDYKKLPEIFSKADVSLMTSIDDPMWIEQCGYTVGESLLCHTPVITSFSKSIMEMWKVPNVSFISQNDSEALFDALTDTNIYGEAKDGRQAVIDKYSVEKVGQKYIDIFSENI